MARELRQRVIIRLGFDDRKCFFLGYVHTILDNWHENLFGILLRSIRYVTLHAREVRGTPGNSWWGVPPGSPNSDPTLKSIPVFRSGL